MVRRSRCRWGPMRVPPGPPRPHSARAAGPGRPIPQGRPRGADQAPLRRRVDDQRGRPLAAPAAADATAVPVAAATPVDGHHRRGHGGDDGALGTPRCGRPAYRLSGRAAGSDPRQHAPGPVRLRYEGRYPGRGKALTTAVELLDRHVWAVLPTPHNRIGDEAARRPSFRPHLTVTMSTSPSLRSMLMLTFRG
jgi:hypothetical protein